MVSLADSVSHRARFVWLGAALASALAMFVATRPTASASRPNARNTIYPVGHCAEHARSTPKPEHVHVYTGLMVGRMGDEPYLHLMENLVTTALAKQPAWIVETTLTAGDASGFAVSGTLDTLTVEPEDGNSYVRCKVSIGLASYPDQHVLAHLSGGASVKGSTSTPEDLAYAQQACVTAVVDDLTATKLIPAIEANLRR